MNNLLDIKNLSISFKTPQGLLTAVDKLNISVKESEIVGIVGESGCGKSVMSQSILRLLEHSSKLVYSGQIIFDNNDILSLPMSKVKLIRGNDIGFIFQNPLTSLNPVYTIGNQMLEHLLLHKKMKRKDAKEKCLELLNLTGIRNPKNCLNQYPHELSGGMLQRVMIATALLCEPRLLIADEPTTALDVTIQAQILELIMELNEKLKMAVLFITHNFGVVSEICHSVRVMYLGQVVEEAKTEELFKNPLHPYTQGLINAIPQLNTERNSSLYTIPGNVPSLSNIPKGCRFSTRCKYVHESCMTKEAEFIYPTDSHGVKCNRYIQGDA